MHSWRDDAEQAIGEQTGGGSMSISRSPVSSAEKEAAATLGSQSASDEKDEQDEQVEKGINVVETTAHDSGEQSPSTPPAQGAADKNPFGLKPEYKTALKDFFVRMCLHFRVCWVAMLTPELEDIYVLDMDGQGSCHCGRAIINRHRRHYACDEHYLR